MDWIFQYLFSLSAAWNWCDRRRSSDTHMQARKSPAPDYWLDKKCVICCWAQMIRRERYSGRSAINKSCMKNRERDWILQKWTPVVDMGIANNGLEAGRWCAINYHRTHSVALYMSCHVTRVRLSQQKRVNWWLSVALYREIHFHCGSGSSNTLSYQVRQPSAHIALLIAFWIATLRVVCQMSILIAFAFPLLLIGFAHHVSALLIHTGG